MKKYVPSWKNKKTIPEIEWHTSSKKMIDTIYQLVRKKSPSITREKFDKLSEPDIINILEIKMNQSKTMKERISTCLLQRYFPVVTDESLQKLKDEVDPVLEEIHRQHS